MVYRIQMEPVLGIETTFIRLRSISHGDKGRVPSNCREDLIKNFDKIGVMKSGKIEELGTYDELMDKRGLLYELAAGRK